MNHYLKTLGLVFLFWGNLSAQFVGPFNPHTAITDYFLEKHDFDEWDLRFKGTSPYWKDAGRMDLRDGFPRFKNFPKDLTFFGRLLMSFLKEQVSTYSSRIEKLLPIEERTTFERHWRELILLSELARSELGPPSDKVTLTELKQFLEKQLGNIDYYSSAFTTPYLTRTSAPRQLNCLAGTNLLLSLAMMYYFENFYDDGFDTSIYENHNLVVIKAPTHILPGRMVKQNGEWFLVGTEMTVKGAGTVPFCVSDQGDFKCQVKHLHKVDRGSYRIMDARLYMLGFLLMPYMKTFEDKRKLLFQAMQWTNWRYDNQIPIEKLEKNISDRKFPDMTKIPYRKHKGGRPEEYSFGAFGFPSPYMPEEPIKREEKELVEPERVFGGYAGDHKVIPLKAKKKPVGACKRDHKNDLLEEREDSPHMWFSHGVVSECQFSVHDVVVAPVESYDRTDKNTKKMSQFPGYLMATPVCQIPVKLFANQEERDRELDDIFAQQSQRKSSKRIAVHFETLLPHYQLYRHISLVDIFYEPGGLALLEEPVWYSGPMQKDGSYNLIDTQERAYRVGHFAPYDIEFYGEKNNPSEIELGGLRIELHKFRSPSARKAYYQSFNRVKKVVENSEGALKLEINLCKVNGRNFMGSFRPVDAATIDWLSKE